MNDTRRSNLEWASLLLRLSLGLLFLVAGLNKFIGGYSGSVGWIISEFNTEEIWLPIIMVKPYAYALPFIEVILGALLVVGFLTRPALILTGLTLLSLALGMILQKEFATVSNNLIYVAITAAALGLSEFKRYSLDGMMGSASPPSSGSE